MLGSGGLFRIRVEEQVSAVRGVLPRCVPRESHAAVVFGRGVRRSDVVHVYRL